MVPWWLVLLAFAGGFALAWGLILIPFCRHVFREVWRVGGEIDQRNSELDARIKNGSRQQIARPVVGPKGGTGTPPKA